MTIEKNLVLIGMPGSGKTTISEILSNKVGMKLLNIDKYIEKNEGKSISDIFLNGEDYFREIESQAVEVISKETGTVIDTGGGVIKNPKNIQLLRENGVIVFINRPLENILSDLQVGHRPLLKDGKERIYKLFEERYDIYKSSCDYELVNDKDINYIIDSLNLIIEGKI